MEGPAPDHVVECPGTSSTISKSDLQVSSILGLSSSPLRTKRLPLSWLILLLAPKSTIKMYASSSSHGVLTNSLTSWLNPDHQANICPIDWTSADIFLYDCHVVFVGWLCEKMLGPLLNYPTGYIPAVLTILFLVFRSALSQSLVQLVNTS